MSNARKEQKKRQVSIATLVCMVLLALVAGIAIGFVLDLPINPEVLAPVPTPTATELPAGTVEPNRFEMEEEGLRIYTQYASLLYPMDFVNDVMVNAMDETGKSEINVFSAFDGAELELFSIVLSTTEGEGHKMGVLKREDSEVGIYIRMNEVNVENWPEEEVVRLNRLQESVNALLEQLYQDEGFTNN